MLHYSTQKHLLTFLLCSFLPLPIPVAANIPPTEYRRHLGGQSLCSLISNSIFSSANLTLLRTDVSPSIDLSNLPCLAQWRLVIPKTGEIWKGYGSYPFSLHSGLYSFSTHRELPPICQTQMRINHEIVKITTVDKPSTLWFTSRTLTTSALTGLSL